MFDLVLPDRPTDLVRQLMENFLVIVGRDGRPHPTEEARAGSGEFFQRGRLQPKRSREVLVKEGFEDLVR